MVKFIIFILINSYLYGQENNSNGRLEYVLKADKLPIQTAFQFVLRGHPLGQNILLEEVQVSANNMGEYLKGKKEKYSEAKDKTVVKTSEILSQIQSSDDFTVTELPEDETLKIEFDIDKFIECTQSSLLTYQKLFAIQNNNFISELEKKALTISHQQRLNYNRGLNSQENSLGIICGKHIAQLSFSKFTPIEEYKFLQTINKLSKDEAIKYLTINVAIYHTDSPTFQNSAIDFLRRYAMTKIVFKNETQLTSEEQMQKLLANIDKEYESQNSDPSGASTTEKAINQWPKVKEGLNWAESFVNEAVNESD